MTRRKNVLDWTLINCKNIPCEIAASKQPPAQPNIDFYYWILKKNTIVFPGDILPSRAINLITSWYSACDCFKHEHDGAIWKLFIKCLRNDFNQNNFCDFWPKNESFFMNSRKRIEETNNISDNQNESDFIKRKNMTFFILWNDRFVLLNNPQSALLGSQWIEFYKLKKAKAAQNYCFLFVNFIK